MAHRIITLYRARANGRIDFIEIDSRNFEMDAFNEAIEHFYEMGYCDSYAEAEEAHAALITKL